MLPLTQISIIGGGLHADNPLEIQDFLVVPLGADTFHESVHMAWQVRTAAGELVREMGHPLLVGDGGGFAPPLRRNQLAIELVLRAIERAGFRPGEDLALAMDIAANHLWSEGEYILDAKRIPRPEFIDLLAGWCEKFPIISIEDPFDEDDTESWRSLTARVGTLVQLVGDDLFVTNPTKLAHGIDEHLGNAILIKPNQIGTLTQTMAVVAQAHQAGFGTVVSIRSGESEDAFITDLAVATSAGQIKLGSLARASRTAKFNNLLRIEHNHGTEVPYAGGRVLRDILPDSRLLQAL
jgi:enolase